MGFILLLDIVAQHKIWSKEDDLPEEKQLKWKQEVPDFSFWFELRLTKLEMSF